MDENSDNQKRLTRDTELKFNPSWSPDGQQIAYEASRQGAVFQIYVVEADGSGRKKRLTHDAPHKTRPAWSPDGDTIAYALRVPAVRTTIHLMTANGDYLKQLSGEHGGDDTGPDWFDPVAWSVSPATNFVTIWGKIKVPASGSQMIRTACLKLQLINQKGGNDVIQS